MLRLTAILYLVIVVIVSSDRLLTHEICYEEMVTNVTVDDRNAKTETVVEDLLKASIK